MHLILLFDKLQSIKSQVLAGQLAVVSANNYSVRESSSQLVTLETCSHHTGALQAAGAAAYKKNDDKGVTKLVSGQDTDVMSAQQFSDLLYTQEFESLDSLLQQLKVAA